MNTRVRKIGEAKVVILGARDYIGMGKDRLLELAAQGRIQGYLDTSCARGKSAGEWWFNRKSLDAFRLRESGFMAHEERLLKARERAGL